MFLLIVNRFPSLLLLVIQVLIQWPTLLSALRQQLHSPLISSSQQTSQSLLNMVNYVGAKPFVVPWTNKTAITEEDLTVECPFGAFPYKEILWEKNGRSLPLNSRHFVDQRTGLLTVKRVQKEDSGTYKCTVSGENGESASGVTYVVVGALPVIDGHFFPESIQAEEGTRTRLLCSINKGDPSFRIKWFKNDKPLEINGGGSTTSSTSSSSTSSSSSSSSSTSLDRKHSSSNKYRFKIQHQDDSSSIVFKSLTVSDAGKYACLASNQYGSTERTTYLVVNSAPKWIIEPENNVSGILGQEMMIHCIADGYPPPTLNWEKGEGDGGRKEFVTINRDDIHIINNGSLFFESLREVDQGFYLCTANNGIGAGISKAIFVRVHRPPRLQSKESSVSIKQNGSLVLTCEAEGDLPIGFTWLKDEEKLDLTVTNKKRTMKEESLKEKSLIISRLTITGVQRTESGHFKCVARNDFGSTSLNIKVTILEPPSKPYNLTIVNVTSRSFTLKWIWDFDGNSPIKRYRVFYGQLRNLDGKKKRTWTPTEDDSLTKSGLVLDNDNTNNNSNNNNGENKGNIEGEDENEMTEERVAVVEDDDLFGGDDGSFKDTLVLKNLKPVTKYTLTIAPENEIGFGPRSDPINGTTSQEAPGGPPKYVNVQSTGSQSLKVSWTPPDIDVQYGPILGYYIGYGLTAEDDTSQYQFKHFVPNSMENDEKFYTIYLTNLKRLSKYSIVVQAYNAAGTGPLSDPLEATTLETSPPISPSLTVSDSTNTSIKVIWSRDEKHGSILTQYTFYWKEESRKDWNQVKLPSNLEEYTLTDLLCGTRYQFFITATNSLGTGEPSPIVSHRTRGAAPVSPLSDVALVRSNSTSSNSEIILNLDAWSNGGCKIHYFTIQKKLKQSNHWTMIQDRLLPLSPSKKWFPLGSHYFLPGREYVILVTARNDAGITQAEYELIIPRPTFTVMTTKLPAVALNNHNLLAAKNGDMNGGPLYRSVAFVLPIAVSFSVIILLLLVVFICLRKTPEPIYNTYAEHSKPSNSLTLSELSSQRTTSSKTKLGSSSGNLRSDSVHSQLSSACVNQMSPAHLKHIHQQQQQQQQQQHATHLHDYTEPYPSAVGREHCQHHLQQQQQQQQALLQSQFPLGKDQFATIKRANPRTRSSVYVSGYEAAQLVSTEDIYTKQRP